MVASQATSSNSMGAKDRRKAEVVDTRQMAATRRVALRLRSTVVA